MADLDAVADRVAAYFDVDPETVMTEPRTGRLSLPVEQVEALLDRIEELSI